MSIIIPKLTKDELLSLVIPYMNEKTWAKKVKEAQLPIPFEPGRVQDYLALLCKITNAVPCTVCGGPQISRHDLQITKDLHGNNINILTIPWEYVCYIDRYHTFAIHTADHAVSLRQFPDFDTALKVMMKGEE